MRDVTVFGEFEVAGLEAHLSALGPEVLFLIESYNQPALKLVQQLGCNRTAYCQAKLLHQLHQAEADNTGTTEDVTVRNFVIGKDERAYASFYNAVLGYLGSTVDESFVRGLTMRPSFDSSGYFIAERCGEIVAFLSIERDPLSCADDSFAYIFQVGTARELRATGLATVLLGHAQGWARRKNCTRIGVGVSQGNLEALRFFKRNNFEERYNVTGFLVNTCHS